MTVCAVACVMAARCLHNGVSVRVHEVGPDVRRGRKGQFRDADSVGVGPSVLNSDVEHTTRCNSSSRLLHDQTRPLQCRALASNGARVRLRIANPGAPSQQDLPPSDTKHDKRRYTMLDTGAAEDVAERAAEREVEAVADKQAVVAVVLHRRMAGTTRNKISSLCPLVGIISRRCTGPAGGTTISIWKWMATAATRRSSLTRTCTTPKTSPSTYRRHRLR
jgi:hypothetical protein